MRVIISFIFLLTAASLSGMGSRPMQDVPLKPSRIKLTDGEYIRMGDYAGGEKRADLVIVARIREKQADFYGQNLAAGSKQTLPGNYTNFSTFQFSIDLETGSLIRFSYNEPFTNSKGLVRLSLELDTNKDEVIAENEFMDNGDRKISRPKISVRKGFPVCNLWSLTYAARFLDITGPGILYICEPSFMKEPIPFTFHFAAREKVKTPAGEFNTIKISPAVADPFLSKLLLPFLKETYMWVEDSPRMLLVKSTGPRGIFLLEEISSMQKKGIK